MPISIATESIIGLTAAAKRLPKLRNDRPVSPATIWRWYRFGIHGIKLETIVVGGTRATSVEALNRFLAAINGQTMAETATDSGQVDSAAKVACEPNPTNSSIFERNSK